MTGPSPLQPVLDRLAAFEPVGLPVISLYLDTGPDQNGRPYYDAFLRKELRARGESFPARSPERESYDKDQERILAYVTDELQPSANGLAVFACSGADGLFETVQLDTRLEAHSLHVADRPHVYPLARVAEQHPAFAVLIADTNAARLYVVGSGTTLRSDSVTNEKVSRTSVGGWSQMRYQRHIENFHLRHAKEVVTALERVVREDGVQQIVLAGDEVIIPLLREQMPESLAERVVDVLRLDMTTPEHEVVKATTEALREHDAETDAEAVAQMLGQYRAGQLGVAGAARTLAALQIGQVDTLLLSAAPDAVHDDAPADTPDEASDTLEGGDPAPIAERLVRLAQQTSAGVRFIEDTSLLADVGGVGATLRYRLDPRAIWKEGLP